MVVLVSEQREVLAVREGMHGWLPARTGAAASAGPIGEVMNLKILPALGVLLLAGCVTAPTGPSREAFPGRDKTFEQFQADDAACRDYALVKTGGKPAADRANEAAVGSAVVGTALGAAAGALIGGNAAGAGVGAGIGLLTGSAVGSGTAAGTYHST